MKKKSIILSIIIVLIAMLSGISKAALLPEKTLNIEFKNLNENSKIYVLISEDLLNYNLEHEIENEKDVPDLDGLVNQESYKKIKELYANHDYIGYANYYVRGDVDNDSNLDGKMLLRSYYFAFNSSKVIDEYKYNDKTYLRVLATLKDNKVSIIMQDYLYDYDLIDTKIMLEDADGKTNIVDLKENKYEDNSSENQQLKKCDITIDCSNLKIENRNNIQDSNSSNESINSKDNNKNISSKAIIIVIMLLVIAVLICFIVKRKNTK